MVPINCYAHTAITHAEKSASRIKLATKPCVKRFTAQQNAPLKYCILQLSNGKFLIMRTKKRS